MVSYYLILRYDQQMKVITLNSILELEVVYV